MLYYIFLVKKFQEPIKGRTSDVNAGAFLSTRGLYDINARKLAMLTMKVVNATVGGWRPSTPSSIHDGLSDEVELGTKAMFGEESIFGVRAVARNCFS